MLCRAKWKFCVFLRVTGEEIGKRLLIGLIDGVFERCHGEWKFGLWGYGF